MPAAIEPEIVEFLVAHHVLNLATLSSKGPYCCSCFYVLETHNLEFVIKSSAKSRHVTEFLADARIAGSIHRETEDLNLIQGVQFTGKIYQLLNSIQDSVLRDLYLNRFQIAEEIPGDYFRICVQDLKMTDNVFKFGHKRYWSKKEATGGYL